jgi:hypothetical protein
MIIKNGLWAGGYFIFISLSVYMLLWIVKRYDPEYHLERTIWLPYLVYGGALSIAFMISFLLPNWDNWQRAGAVLLGIYLLTATITDIQTKEVYDFLPYIGLSPGIALLLCAHSDISLWMNLILYCLIQFLIFSRLFGMADAKAFVVCAIYISVGGGRFPDYLFHMSAAFLLLVLIQLYKHNISRRGKLKVAVPFIPYIAVTIWLILIFPKA